ncbi:N(5)-(carboxyethyl)ornithine synthase [Pseudolactococcus insecticola]|uniref:Alanine dehydrogenase n=1 Tax=Pseudolactococcus insecticola TaxID=2709158 RepID=A0A6A0B8I7_9LACT|nr:N(5)-(carboxyethyl)ornithine synthase [Lactococcus insecticola]GFH40741.1 alanine dehydrogenase [Lactococcus insecticola]
MNTIGFLKSHKEHEHRIAILPHELTQIRFPEQIYLEENYGRHLGISDESYTLLGAHVTSRTEVLKQDILCEPKIGDSDILDKLTAKQTIFGWIHATQSLDITDLLVKSHARVIAWEKMYEDNQHTFWRNNELAGEAAILHAYLLTGQMPYDTKVALIGRGSVAFGATRVLQGLGADITVIRRNQEELLTKTLGDYDVIVNASLWDITRDDFLICKEDLARMNPGALIIDISADATGGGIETSHITDFANPTYQVEQITHYVVDHTPSLLYRTASKSISKAILPYLDDLILGKENTVLHEATIIDKGLVIDPEILAFQQL